MGAFFDSFSGGWKEKAIVDFPSWLCVLVFLLFLFPALSSRRPTESFVFFCLLFSNVGNFDFVEPRFTTVVFGYQLSRWTVVSYLSTIGGASVRACVSQYRVGRPFKWLFSIIIKF